MKTNYMIDQTKRDRKVWEESTYGKEYALIRNQVLKENNVSELGFDQIQKLIKQKIMDMSK